MNEEVVNIVIKPEVDFSGMREEVAAAGKEIRAMKEDMTEMPNISRMLNSSLERTASIADSITGKIDALQKNGYEEDGTRSRRISDVEESKKDLDVLRSLQLGDSSYGIQMAKSWFRTLPQAVQKEFDAITPRISAIIRSRMSSLTKDGLHFEGSSIEELSRQIMSDKEIQKLIGNNVRHGDQNQFRDYLKHMLPNTVALNRLNSWHEARYGSAIPRGQDAIMSARPETLFPKSYVESYQNKGFKRASLTPEQAAMVMDRKHLFNLGRVFADNPIAVKAAIASGISRRDDRGILETREEISRAQWEDYREKLYHELENRASGVGKGRVDFYSQEDKDIKTLARRLSSSSSGTTMLAMHALEAMNDPSVWVASQGKTGYIKQQTEAKRMLDRYATTKYSPFTSGGWEKSQNVMIPESQNTDLFGRRNWKNNQDISDTIALVSLAGYNEKNPEHFNTLRNLYANGKEINGVQMVAVGTHGNGNDTVVRMASKAEVDRIEKEEQEWARAHGFSGSYFGNYTDAERARRAALPVGDKERLTVTDLGKQFDAENKGWSPSANLGINLNGKRFALVDYGDEGDGSGWVSSSVLPHSIQGRFGVAGKGSLYTVYAKNNREFAEKNGLLDENGRWMATGINGEKFDIADYDGVIPTSMIKNMMAYRRADGSLPSPQEASAMLTAAMQRYGLRAISDYETENTNSNRLGTQMTSFMRFSSDLQRHQIEMAAKRMGELETEEGMLRYVFNNPENDYVANQVWHNRQLLATPTARARVDAYKESIMRDIVSGQYVDFGESDSKISDIRAAENPLRAFFASNGGMTSEFLARARTALQKAHGREYTDKEISDLINLGKDENGIERAIDFNHINEDKIGILRSPTGYGNMVYAKNVAAEAAPLFDEFKINKTGAFVSANALETLQSADYDGDRFKVVVGDLAEAVKQTMDEVDAQKSRIKGKDTSIKTTPVAYDEVDITDEATQRALAAGRNIAETRLMGAGSAGIRGAMLDLSNPSNDPYIIAQEKLQQIYDKGSVYHKKPEDVDLKNEREYWDTLRLGKEWTKFSDKASELFQFDPDQLDENNKPIEGKDTDVFRASNGRLVNMRRLRDMDIENTNLPSIFMDAHVMGLGSARRIYQENRSETAPWDAIAEAMEHLDYHGGGEAAQRLMKTMRPLFPQFGSGARGQLEPEEEIAIRGMIADLRGELKAEADKSKIIGTGMWHSDKSNKDYYSEDAFIEGEGRRYGLHTAEQAVNLFGFTRDRISRRFGEQHANDLLANDPTISFVGEKAEQSAQEAAESSRKASEEAAKQQQEIAKAQEESSKAGKAIVEVSKMLPSEARSVKPLETAEQEAQRLLKESGLRRGQIDAFMGLPRDLAAEAITDNNPEALLTKGIGGKTASRIIGALVGSRYADFKITPPGPDRAHVTSEQVPSAENFVPKEPEQMMICDICGTEFPASLGKCPNEANHPNKLTRRQMRKREAMDQKQLAKVQAVESDASQTLEESYGKILSSFAGIESSKAIATKMIEGFGETIKGHNRILNANTDQTAAEKFYGIEGWKKRKAHQDFDWANQNLAKEVFGEGTELRKKAQASLDYIDSGYINATRQWSGDQSGKIVEGLRKSVTGVGDEFDLQEAQVKSYSEAIKELESNLKQFQESRNQLAQDAADNGQFLPKSMTDADQATLDKMKKDLEEAQALRDQGIANIKTKNNQSFMDRADTLYDRMYGKTATPLQKVDRQVAGFQSDIAAEMARLETAKEKDKITEEDYLARKQRFEELQQYADGNLRNDLYNRYFDQASKQTDRMIMQSDRMTRQRHMRASMAGVGRFMLQNENEYQQRELTQNAMQTRMDELVNAQSGMKEGTAEYARATEEINKLSQAMEQNKSAMDALKGPAGALNAVFGTLQMSVARLVSRLGRQMFMKALNEAKKFVQEFDKSMTSIQMITLKSDKQMSTLGDGLISKAKELKISIAEIAQSAETLYRQGLSDEEVNQRLDVISKFSKVSGTKVDAATKLVTIAMNTGLVSDPQVAADIVTALGDNAATNASEIEKGIEKAGAAAAADGTTFAQLASMLTAITSTTQIGGNVAGRTLNTIFGRMNKIGTNELIYDENGYAISGSAVAKLLQAQGIEQYENGKKKSSYDVLYELSQKWDKMSDAEQQQIATAIAGTRQYSNFAAIMQGMSEGKVADYMALTEGSGGIVDEKYEIYVKSLQASLTELKNTFDELVHDLTEKGTLTEFIDGITGAIQGVDNLANSIGGLGASLITVLPLLAAVTMLKSGMPIAGLALAAFTMFGLNMASNIDTTKEDPTKINGISANEYATKGIKTRNETTLKADNLISESKELLAKTDRTTEEDVKLQQNLTDLSEMFSYLGISVDDLTGSSKKASKALSEIYDVNEENKKKNTLQELKDIRTAMDTEGSSQILASTKDVKHLATAIWSYDNERYKNESGYDSEGYGYLWRDIQDPTKLRNIAYGLTTEGRRGLDVSKDFGQDPRLPLWALRSVYANGGTPFGGGTEENFSEVKSLIKYFIDSGYYAETDSTLQAMLANPEAQGLTLDDILAGKTGGYFGKDFSDMFFNATAKLFQRVFSGEMGGIVSGNIEEIKEERSKVVQNYSGMLKETLLGSANAPDEATADALIKDWENSVLVEGYEDLPAESFFSLLAEKYDEFCNKIFADDGSANNVQPISTVIKQEEDDGKLYAYKGETGLTRSEAYSKYRADEAAAEEKEAPEIEMEFTYGHNGKSGLTYEQAEDSLHQQAFAAYAGKGVADQGYYDTETDTHYRSEEDLENAFESVALASMGEDIANGTLVFSGSKEEREKQFEEAKRKYKVRAAQKAIDSGRIHAGVFVMDENQETFIPLNELDAWVDEAAEADNWSRVDLPTMNMAYSFNGEHGLTWDQAISKQNDYKRKDVGREPVQYFESRTAKATKTAKENESAADQKKTHANNFVEQVMAAGVTDMQSLLEAVERGEIADFDNIVSDLGLADTVERAYSFNPSTGKIEAYDDGGALFAKIMSAATANSSLYSGIGENAYITKREHGLNVADYLKQFYEEGMDGRALSTTDEELKAVLGADLASRFIEARTSGNMSKISKEEYDYATKLANNYALGVTGLTTGEILSGIKEVRKNIGTIGVQGGYNKEIADQYMSQWSGWNEYSALMTKKNNGETLTSEEQDRLDTLETSLDNFQENSEIKFKTEGIQELENAGKIASGVSSEIEKLHKGGKVALEVTMKYRVEGFSAGQQTAKLYNGSETEQDEAAMAILGMDRDQYYSNRSANLERARSANAADRQYWADTWTERYNGAETPEQRLEIIEAAKAAGYGIREKNISYGPNGRTSDWYFDWENAPKIANVGSLVGQEREYTETEKNAALDQILAGTLTRVAEGEGANTELFDAAVNSAGENTRELLRRWQNSGTELNYADWLNSATDIPEWLKAGSRAERSDYYQSRYGSLYSTRTQETLARQGLLGDVNNEENASAVASYLSMDQTRVSRMMKSGKTEELTKLIEEKSNAAIESAKNELSTEFPELQFNATTWDELIAEIEAAAEQADGELKDRLLAYRDALLDGAVVLTPEEAIEKYSTWSKTQKDSAYITAIQGQVTEGMTWDQVKEKIIGPGLTFETPEDFNSFLGRNTGMADVFARAQDEGSFTPEIMNSLMQVSPAAVLNPDENFQLQYSKWNQLQGENGGIDIDELTALAEEDQGFREWLGQFETLPDLLNDAQGMADGTSKAFKSLHAEMYAGLLKSLRPWGDATDEIVENGKAATKSLRGQADANIYSVGLLVCS